MLTGRMIKAARVLLDWDQARLAKAADVGVISVKRVEALQEIKKDAEGMATIRIRRALREAGIIFVRYGLEDGNFGSGVVLLDRPPEPYAGDSEIPF